MSAQKASEIVKDLYRLERVKKAKRSVSMISEIVARLRLLADEIEKDFCTTPEQAAP
jgi:hypothetical protein